MDGHDREVDVYNFRKANPNKPATPLVYWGKYVQHDNNRDGLGMGLALSRIMMSSFLEYHPTVLHDLHESQPFLYVSTGMGPYNGWAPNYMFYVANGHNSIGRFYETFGGGGADTSNPVTRATR